MNEKQEEDEFEDDDVDELLEAGDDVDVDRVILDLDKTPHKGDARVSEPAWRRLERMREERLTAELTSDFDDYDIGLLAGSRPRRKAHA